MMPCIGILKIVGFELAPALCFYNKFPWPRNFDPRLLSCIPKIRIKQSSPMRETDGILFNRLIGSYTLFKLHSFIPLSDVIITNTISLILYTFFFLKKKLTACMYMKLKSYNATFCIPSYFLHKS